MRSLSAGHKARHIAEHMLLELLETRLAHHGDHAELEIRASWTPTDGRIDRHFQAWQDLICMLSGLPPRQVNSVPAPVGSVQHSDVGEPEGANFDEKGPGSTSEIN